MIGYLRGLPIRLKPDSVLLDVGGVGYALSIPLSTFYALEQLESGPASLFVHTHVREDDIALYGFATEGEKALFEKLIQVSGVGPRLATVILSGMAPAEVVTALAGRDANRLTRIPGVGRKTAERLVLELTDKVADLLQGGPQLPTVATSPGDADVVSALVNLGYKAPLAEKAVADARQQLGGEAEFHQVLRTALQRFTRP